MYALIWKKLRKVSVVVTDEFFARDMSSKY